MTRSQRLVSITGAAVVLVAILAGIVLAQASDKVRSGQTVTVAAGETVAGDLYAFGGTIRVEGTVDGDLVAAGGTIDVVGNVTGDLLVTGGTIDISGTVGGDARAGGGTITVSGMVTEDVLAFGGQVAITSTGTVGEDLFAAAGRLAIDGTVTGDVLASAGTYMKSGTVGGTEDVRITGGDVTEPVQPTPTDQIAGAVRHFLVVLLAGALLIWIVPRLYTAATAAIRQRPLVAAGWGVVGFVGYVVLLVVVVIATILLAIAFGLLGFGDLVGISIVGGIVVIAAATLVFLVAAAYVVDAIVGAALAGLVVRGPSATRIRELAMLAAGAAVVVAVSSLPIVGPWVKLVVVLIGIGALLMAIRHERSPAGATATSAAPASSPES